MPKGTPVFAPSGLPPNGPVAYVLAAINPGFTHDEFTVTDHTVTTYLLHQSPARFSCLVALNGAVLSETVDYDTNYDNGEITIHVTLHNGDKIEARYAVALVEENAVIRVTDAVSITVPVVSDSTVTLATQTPIIVSATEAITVTDIVVVGDSVNTGVALIETTTGVADSDDGWTSTVPGFTNTGPTVQVGNSAGEVRQAFIRFAMPHDLAGRDIVHAVLRFTPDAATAAPGVMIRIAADASGTATAPTSKADYDSRTLTFAHVDWQTALVAGTSIDSPDLSSIIAELAAAGTTTEVLLMLLDNGSATDEFAQIRSFTHSTGPIPQLIVTFI